MKLGSHTCYRTFNLISGAGHCVVDFNGNGRLDESPLLEDAFLTPRDGHHAKKADEPMLDIKAMRRAAISQGEERLSRADMDLWGVGFVQQRRGLDWVKPTPIAPEEVPQLQSAIQEVRDLFGGQVGWYINVVDETLCVYGQDKA